MIPVLLGGIVPGMRTARRSTAGSSAAALAFAVYYLLAAARAHD